MTDFISFGVIVDDIVYPGGETRMGVLGGGGPQTAFGMRCWSESVGLVAGIGEEIKPVLFDWLSVSRIDSGGIRISEVPTPRAWQLLEFDDRRTQVWRVAPRVVQEQLGRSIGNIPGEYQNAKGYHFGIHPDEPDIDFIRSLKELGGIISIEPFKPAEKLLPSDVMHQLMSQIDIFSTNLVEAESLTGRVGPDESAARLLGFGTQVVVMRMGERGSIVYERENKRGLNVPALNVQVVDPVGAGNAYCGGFLVEWANSHDGGKAGMCGSVAASFLLEQVGVPEYSSRVEMESQRRLRHLQMQMDN